LTVLRETLTQYITFNRGGRRESVLCYSVVLQPYMSCLDPSERTVTKSPKVGPLLIFSISLVHTKEDIIDGTLTSENIAEEWGGGGQHLGVLEDS
jgi:hypothetical protein